MTVPEVQETWSNLDKVKQTKIAQICPACNKPTRADSSKAPYHFKCWLKTEEGKEYMRLKKQESRSRLGRG